MKKACFIVLVMFASSAVLAQGTLTPGKYTGNLEFVSATGKPRTDGIEIVIATVEGGSVAGTWRRMSGFCGGEFPVVGELEGDNLRIHTRKGDPAVKDTCDFSYDLKINGPKLEGKSASGAIVRVSR